MKKFLKVADYVQESGLPEHLVRRLTRCALAEEFCFRASGSKNATIYINTERLEKMLMNGDLKEVLEG